MFTHTHLHTHSYKPWLDETDKDNVFFASVHGYAKFDSFYPSSGVCVCVCVIVCVCVCDCVCMCV
jgi:hypothetical protein